MKNVKAAINDTIRNYYYQHLVVKKYLREAIRKSQFVVQPRAIQHIIIAHHISRYRLSKERVLRSKKFIISFL